ncbi:pyruvate, phosphate dikinase [Halanaerobium hydrogeniformans]|uniref:Pyruvate, phosphate dikinase n=1 Tax=Halanaerobium hydrogeniformans TaxID=656519 RepID=E4RNY2_HALHG|nr:pyruvate, phosphate dikinase [Halanaerobium hydrogeniformans]ADQ13672.1 pyruvate, phosphate dikinase [Halanaerobium hydrogeniformans]
MQKFIYNFQEGKTEMKALLGGKGANLAEMNKIGLPVPPGFTITTEACIRYLEMGEKLDENLQKSIFEYLEELEKENNKKFGDLKDPLLLSVRSGAVTSMPGMMDTILNLGLNDKSVKGLAKKASNPRFAYDSYRRLIQMFANVVLDIPGYEFDNLLEKKKEKNDYNNDTELNVDDLKEIIEEYKSLIKEREQIEFPQKPGEQLLMAVKAVFSSWNNPRARSYRNINDIPHDLGTAVTVQTMVFGNIGENSGTGVAFTRNPATGENKVFGEFLLNAQGEDVVAGIRTPKDINELEKFLPEVYTELMEITRILEKHYEDMQDIEFTIQEGNLYLLQTRTGKRTADAAVKIAVDMKDEGLIDKKTAILRVDPEDINQLLHPNFKEDELKKADLLAIGLAASPGAATGKIYFRSEDAVQAVTDGEDVILVRKETSPEDIEGMAKTNGVLTSRGGMTSHAAVVARGMGKCCVAGVGDIKVDEAAKKFYIDDRVFKEGDYISLNGSLGEVYAGIVETTDAHLSDNFKKLMQWSDQYRKLKIYTNADNQKDAVIALNFGAEGIGLCRTEHMFFDSSRINSVREMIVANTSKKRKKALDKLFPYQKDDFKELFKVMEAKDLTIRLLDPPLHEFLPQEESEIKSLADELSISIQELKTITEELAEVNPMLGHRGCRLGISYPEIYKMQVKAIISAALEVKAEKGYDVKADIMIPLIGTEKELAILREQTLELAEELIAKSDAELNYSIGTMIEIPRAALLADEIAKHADFFSFGTNDLTQMTYGFSRDDSGRFINHYLEQEIFKKDPFTVLDQSGVGKLLKMGVELGRKTKEDLKIGICGEHGGEPASIDFCHKIALDYVSCSPYRVPIARLAAAQSAIKND